MDYAPHLTFVAIRGFLAGLVLLVPALIMRRPQPRDIKTGLMLAAIGLGTLVLKEYLGKTGKTGLWLGF